MKRIFVNFTGRDRALWIGSMIIVLLSNLFSPQFDALITIAALIGITSLILGAKGNVWAQVLMVIFSILYGIISYRFHYWGEMITYLGMTMPMAAWSAVVWARNPSKNAGEVAVSPMTGRKWALLTGVTVIVTAVFCLILKAFDTPNIIFGTLSVTTSFMAAALTLLRSSYYPLLYAANDLILIVLWILAAIADPVYLPVIINFVIFFINDFYGFVSWRKREKAA